MNVAVTSDSVDHGLMVKAVKAHADAPLVVPVRGSCGGGSKHNTSTPHVAAIRHAHTP